MREMVLLGAGASVEAGIPGAYDMTRQMVERFSQQYHLAEYSRVLRFAVGGLLFQQGVANRNPYAGVNIEEVFNAIELLAARNELEAAPFVGSWHPLVEDLDKDGPSSQELREVM